MRWLLIPAILLAGCGKAEMAKRGPDSRGATRFTAEPTESPPAGVAKSDAAVPPQSGISRKIIYRAQVDLVAEDFAGIPAQVTSLATQFGGFVANSRLTSLPGTARSGTWTIRVPVDQYEPCLAAARKLGEVRNVSSNSRDVTEEYYDLEARIRNKKQEEDRLLKLLATATGKLEEVLSVERELSRVRGEIEQMEGRKRVLTDLAALSTIQLSIEEIKGYVPEEGADYRTRVRRAFDTSVRALFTAGTELSIFAVVLAPWAAVLAVPAILVLLVLAAWRRARRKK
jgi:hypothetical protein